VRDDNFALSMQIKSKFAMKAAAALASFGLLLLIALVQHKANQRRLYVLYNKWGTNDNSGGPSHF
jgi:hypothetical protein